MSEWRTHASWLVFAGGLVVAAIWGIAGHTPLAAGPDTAPVEARALPLPPASREAGLTRRDVASVGAPFSVYAAGAAGEAATAAAVRRLRALDRTLSPWRPGSEIARLGHPGLEPGADARALIRRATRLARLAGGAYEPGVVDLRGRVAVVPRGAAFDPGPLLTGYAAQAALTAMSRTGATRAAVVVGEDRYLLGEGSEAPWRVTLANPRWPDQSIGRWRASAGAVAHADGEGACRRAIVVTPDREAASVLARIVCAQGPTKGLRWAERRRGLEALIVSRDGDVRRSRGWPAPALTRASARSSARSRSVPATASVAAPSTRSAPAPARPGTSSKSSARPDEARAGALVTVDVHLRIDRTEVTNAAYARFLAEASTHERCHPDEPAEKDHTPRYWRRFRGRLFTESAAARVAPFDARTFRDPLRPVVGVDWWDAYAFAAWAGKRLPTRDEWVRAAAGGDARRWPWGDVWDYARANTGGEKWGELDGHIYAAPADAFPGGAARCGALNMAGNAAEWTADGFVAGGSSRSPPSGVRTDAGRERDRAFRSFDTGFRCAADAQEGS